jgi:glutamine cyclotransferase
MTELSELHCVNNEMLANIWQEIEYCLDVCCATNDVSPLETL